jgi:2-methylcitrate dehydratase PrpD
MPAHLNLTDYCASESYVNMSRPICFVIMPYGVKETYPKDKDHIEKAFDFGGMGARNGVMAVTMVQAGMTGAYDVLDGTHNLFIALSTDPKPQEMVNGLGSHFYVADSAIKKFAVGYPIQAPLDAFFSA